MSEARRMSGEFDDLIKPGWLPTSIVVNIVGEEDLNDNDNVWQVDSEDLIRVTEIDDDLVILQLPERFKNHDWQPKKDHPVQVIDGQHRLWAFEDANEDIEFNLPVIAFYGLDLSWQAYLFYTINIKPEKINASLAFDLYPLLRTEDWLTKFEGPVVYRESRSQEITHELWANPKSPWHNHINMLGERGLKRMVRQAAWIRSLMATYVKSDHGTTIGGLFGLRPSKEVLHWNGAQQVAFLIFVGQILYDAIDECDYEWAQSIRDGREPESNEADPAFYGDHTLLNTDQGIRGILFITNDLCYVRTEELELEEWLANESSMASDRDAVDFTLERLLKSPVYVFLADLSSELARFDWRTSSAPDLTESQRTAKLVFRGSGGYRELRRQLLDHLRNQKGNIAESAAEVYESLGY